MKVVHAWLADYLGDNTPTTEKITELFNFHSFEIDGVEKEGEHDVIDVSILPNRSSDCLCHRGIARELATLLDVPLAHDPLTAPLTIPKTDTLSITIEDEMLCRRFALVSMHGITIKDSPEWLKSRLEALGQRSINNVVDATNYVMLGMGQPLHAYDAAKWQEKDGARHFTVRRAQEGEQVTTLTGDTYDLTPDTQIIVDGTNDAAAGIAGIKGGKYAEVDTATTQIILEAGNFDPTLTRKAAQALRLQTDASKRFENNPSPELVPYALEALVALIKDIAGGEVVGMADVYPTKPEEVAVEVAEARTNALLGLSLSRAHMSDVLRRIGARAEETEVGFRAVGPWERTDLTIEEDFIEEIGRVHGYSDVASVVPEAVPLAELNARQYYSDKIRAALVERGFSEVITSSFRKKDEISLLNALASDKGCMRSSLRKNITEVLDKNAPYVDLLGITDVRVFEIGTVFEKGEGTITEHFELALGARIKQTGYTPKDDAVLQEALAALGEILGVTLDAQIEKGVAIINFTQLIAALPAPTAYESYEVGKEIQYKPFSNYPHVSRDIALWTPEGTTAGDVAAALRAAATDLCVRITLFDEFQKDGRISYAFRLVFQSFDKTLTDAEVEPAMNAVNQAATENGWEVR